MKTKILVLLSIALMLGMNANAGDKAASKKQDGIHFDKASWEDILEKAKTENKSIFLDLSTPWCGYCKRMKANVFTDSEVGSYYNANFINVSLDAEKGDGKALAKKYGVNGYPTFVFLNPDGSLSQQESGYHKASKFLELGKSTQ